MKKYLPVFSYAVNTLLICFLIFMAGKRWKFQHDLDKPSTLWSYRSNPQYVEQTNIASAYHRESTFVFLGDSHVYKVHWDELLNRKDIANRGIGSDVTEGYLHRLQSVFDCHPVICFIEGGINDIEHHIPADSTIAHLQVLIDTLRSVHIIPVLHSVLYVAPTAENADFYNDRIEVLNKRILNLARKKEVELIDVCPVLCPGGYLEPKYAQADGTHLTAAAYVRWADFLQYYLNSWPEKK